MSYCVNFNHRPRKAKFEVKEKGSEPVKLCRECVLPYLKTPDTLPSGKYSVREMTWHETKTKTK